MKLKFGSWSLTSLFMVIALVGLQACGGGDDTPPPPPPPPSATGYYDTGTHTELGLNDLKGLVHENRLMFFSQTNRLLYDAEMTITGTDFTANLTVYTDGLNPVSATATGSFVEGSSISGVVSGGGESVDGTFDLSYAVINNQVSDIANVDISWAGQGGGIVDVIEFDTSGQIINFNDFLSTTYMDDCVVSSSLIQPIVSTSLYSLTFTLTGCLNASTTADGIYTGLATTHDENAPYGNFVWMVSNENKLVSFSQDMIVD